MPRALRLPDGQPLGIAAEDDVDAAAGHVGGHGHAAHPPGLGHDLRLTEVLLGVEDLVGDPPLLEQPGEVLGLGHRGRAHQHRLPGGVALGDVVHHGGELGVLRLVDEVGVVVPDERLVGRDGHDGELVGIGELRCLGLRRSGHPRQLLVEAEVVLEGDRGPGVVLLFDPHPLLGLDRLVEAVGPAPPVEGATGELVDDLDLALGHQIVLVPPVQLLGQQGLGEVVHVVDGHRVVQVADAELALDLLDARLGGDDDPLLLVDLVVVLGPQGAHDAGELVVELGRLGGRARDDQRGAGLVDEDRVDLVDDGEGVAPLDHGVLGPGHVVTQVVEPELGVGAVGDVRVVGLALGRAVLDVGSDPAHGQPEEPVELAHPLGVAGGQVVVDRDHVDAVAGQGVDVDRQRGDQGLALAGLHLGDPPEVEGHAPHQLGVEVALAEHPPGRLPNQGEGLDEEVLQALPVVQALPEDRRSGPGARRRSAPPSPARGR